MSVAFQFIDVAIVAVVLLSAVFATYRGFVAESLSIFAWIAAAFATLYFGPWTAYWMKGMVEPDWLREVVGYAVVFIVVLLPIHFASARFAQNVKKSQVGTLDGALGAAFGIFRGLAIIGVLYLVYTAFTPMAEQPSWLTHARLMPVVRTSAEVVSSLIPDQDAPRKNHSGTVQTRTEAPPPAAEPPKTAKSVPVPAPKPAKAKHSKKTYGAKDRQALDRLIETSEPRGKP
jgi:membrane protein required for colicin V production